MESQRELKGLQILEKEGQVKRLDSTTYRVRSQNGNGSYLVVIQGSEYRCECKDWQFRSEFLPDKACKHIVAVRASQVLRQSVSSTSIDLTTKPEECKICKSSDIIRSGRRKLRNGMKQLYFCKSCGYKFSINDGFSKMKNDPKIVVSALDLFFKGLSYRKIVDHIKQNYHVTLTHPAIIKWVRKYTDLIKGYVETLNPKLSAVWHVDEMKQSMGVKGKLEWIWNVMDEETRFWLASQISHTREVEDARRVLHEAKKIAKTEIGKNVNKPLKIVSDGLQSYPEAIRKEFYTMKGPRTEHLRAPGITAARQNNNSIERLNGTKRERMKVMRGYDGMKTGQETTDGERIYYNYIREHSTIGMTPAQKAGIDLGLGENKWLALIKQSVNPTPKTALGERVNLVEISQAQDAETVKPKKWLDRETWKEINSILRTFGFAWISNGKDSKWLKPLDSYHPQVTTRKT